MSLVFATIIFLGIAFALIAIRLLVVKNGEFKGTCASQNPFLSKEGGCSLCGKKAGETTCQMPDDKKNI